MRHSFGSDLPPADGHALVECLRTLSSSRRESSMADIFLSYASEDRPRAERVAAALQTLGWNVWWDRKIPAGRTFADVIEEAISSSRCVIVLWSKESVGSKWVREEADEGEKGRKLIPVLLDDVKPPMGFRSIHAADLIGWDGSISTPGFRQLTADLAPLIGPPPKFRESPVPQPTPGPVEPWGSGKRWVVVAAIAPIVVALGAWGVYAYVSETKRRDAEFAEFRAQQIALAEKERRAEEAAAKEKAELDAKQKASEDEQKRRDGPQGTTPDFNLSDFQKALQGLAVGGGSVPATAVTTAFHVPNLGLRIAFIGPQQSQSLPPGALVMEVEGSGAASKAGIHVFDIIEAIGSHKIDTVDDLRETIRKLGPGKTQFVIRRPNGRKTLAVDCPSCRPE